MLEIKNLHVAVEGKEILSGINLTVNAGEVHAVMGPNGSGKSTLSHVLAGKEGYEVTKGSILFKEKSLLDLEPEERAGEGVFLAFQYPIEIAGVNNVYMLKAALNGIRAYRGESELSSVQFLKMVKDKVKAVGLDEGLLLSLINISEPTRPYKTSYDDFCLKKKKKTEKIEQLAEVIKDINLHHHTSTNTRDSTSK